MAETDGISSGQVTPVMVSSSSFKNGRGQTLHSVSYLPKGGSAPKAALIWHHGYGEYIDRFKAVFTRVAEAGIAVYGFDAHGHGTSEPTDANDRALVWRFSDLVDDNLQFVNSVREQQAVASLPLFQGGNSLGACVALHTVARLPGVLAGLVIQSALVDVEWTLVLRMQAPVGGLLAALAPRARLVPAVRPQDMSQDPAVVKEYMEDPLIDHGNVRARTANELLKGFKALSKLHSALIVPIYAVHGDTDRTTSLAAVQRLLKVVPVQDTQLVVVKGGYHELLQGPETQEVLGGIISWILARTNAQASASVQAPAADAGAQGVAASGPEARL